MMEMLEIIMYLAMMWWQLHDIVSLVMAVKDIKIIDNTILRCYGTKISYSMVILFIYYKSSYHSLTLHDKAVEVLLAIQFYQYLFY